MQKDEIDVLLKENPKYKKSIEKISQDYTLSDFILNRNKGIFTKDTADLRYSLFNIRKQHTYDNSDTVLFRLARDYVAFLHNDVLFESDINEVFYIVAYHYLTLCQHLAYELILSNNAVFASTTAYEQYSQLERDIPDHLLRLLPRIDKEACEFYERCFRIERHETAKHFSLLNILIDFPIAIDTMYFDYEFQKALNLLVFEYRIKIEQ